jgi:hypothetical protein
MNGRGWRDEQLLRDFPNPLQLSLVKRQLPLQDIDPCVFRLQNGGQRRLGGRGGRRLPRAGRRRHKGGLLQLALEGAHRIGRRLQVLRRDTPPSLFSIALAQRFFVLHFGPGAERHALFAHFGLVGNNLVGISGPSIKWFRMQICFLHKLANINLLRKYLTYFL